MSDNLSAFLDMLAWSEGTLAVPGNANGYNVVVGGTLFTSYADHPRKRVWLPRFKEWSTAAGRYQIREPIFDAYKKRLKLPDFSPASQDAIADQLITECAALADINAGNIESAIQKCSSRWASLPGGGYGQRTNSVADLSAQFQSALAG